MVDRRDSRNSLPPAFVLDMGANGLGVARTLGRNGVPVVGVDSRPKAPGLRSRYVRPLVCPDVLTQPDPALDALLKASQNMDGKSTLFPASDAAVLFMVRHQRQLSEHFEFIVPPDNIVNVVADKKAQYEEAVRLGIPVTRTYFPRCMDDLGEIIERVRLPALIKPLHSHLWCRTFGNKGFTVNTPRELRERMQAVFESGHEVLVQSVMWPPGKDLCSVGAYFGRGGYASPPICWRKIRQCPPNFGVGSLVESTHQPEVAYLGMKLMRGLGYRGIGYVEFKKDCRDGRWKMVELNARTGQTNALLAAAGLPLVMFQYCDLIGAPLPSVESYRDGVKWWDAMNDLDSFWRLRRREELTFMKWVRSWVSSEVHAYYAPDDIWPAVARAGFGVNVVKMAFGLLKMDTDEDALALQYRPPRSVANSRAPNVLLPDVPSRPFTENEWSCGRLPEASVPSSPEE